MRRIAGILLAVALILGFSGAVALVPGSYEDQLRRDIRRFSGSPHGIELLNHFTRELQKMLNERLTIAIFFWLLAALVLSLAAVAFSRRSKSVWLPLEGSPTLPGKPGVKLPPRSCAALLGQLERVLKRRAALRPKIENLFGDQTTHESPGQ